MVLFSDQKGSDSCDVSFDNYFSRKRIGGKTKASDTFEFDADASTYFLGIEKTTNTNGTRILADYGYDDDYDEIPVDRSRDVKFVTFNKYSTKGSKLGTGLDVDRIFDDGLNVPVRPPRRKKLDDFARTSSDDTITTSFMNNCHGREMLDSDDDESLLSFDYVVEASLDNGVSTTWRNKFANNCNRSSSTITCTSEDSDSFTYSLSYKSDSTGVGVAEWHVKDADDREGLQRGRRCLLEDSDGSGSRLSLSVDEIRINFNSSEYRSVSESNMTESSCQYHSFSSYNSSMYSSSRSSNDNSELIRSDLHIPKSAALFSSVERWILDIYFSAFAADEQEDAECEDKVSR